MEQVIQNITSGVRKQISGISDDVKRLNVYLDETDLQREFGRKFSRMGINRNSLIKKRDSMVSLVFGPRMSYNGKSKRMNSFLSPRLSSNSDVGGTISVSARRKTGTSSTKSDHINRLTKLFSPISYSYHTSDSSDTANLSIFGPENPIDKEGKIFISAEYSSDEKLLIVFVTQCGNLERHGHCRKLRMCFQQVKDGKASAKEIRKIERSSVCEEFRYNYVYTIPFETFNEMQNSGVTVQIKLKSTNSFGRTKELCSTQVSVQDVEEDPVWRSDKLFI